MGEYISAAMTPQRAPSTSTIRTKLNCYSSLSLSLSAVVLKGIHFSFFREKLLIPRKCRDTATMPLGRLFKYEISNEMYKYIYIYIFDQSFCAFRYEGMNI